MVVVNVHEAKTQLSRLLASVEKGRDVVIARRGRPIARLVPVRPRVQRKPDTLRGQLTIRDDFFDPLPEEELDAWDGGADAGSS